MIVEGINKKIAEAVKAGDELKATTYRLLSSELHNAKIAKMQDLTGEEEIQVVQKEVKKRKDAIEAYENAGADERAQREKDELKILEEFLPEQLSDEDLEKMVDEGISATRASQMSDMGKVIGFVMGKAKGQVEGARVSQMVKSKLS
jgi:uncharacterized protein YqeY